MTYGAVAPGDTPTNDGVDPYAAFLEAMEKRIAGQPGGMGVSFLDIVNRKYFWWAMHVCWRCDQTDTCGWGVCVCGATS